MKTIKVVGVPEHFNLPWHLCIENNEFIQQNIDLQWIDVPQGTGKMCEMLRSGDADLAVILTEGIIKDILAGNPSKLMQFYVESPLIWGIHVDYNSEYQKIEDLEFKKAAISRVGSGSQLMAYVNAQNQDWKTENLNFTIVNTIDGAVDALRNKTADYFMWERFMTAPLVEKRIFRKIADCPSPWPCFVIAVSNNLIQTEPKIITKILDIINLKTFNFINIKNIEIEISKRYNLKVENVIEWLNLTRWSQEKISEEKLNKIQNQLLELAIINKKVTFEEIVYQNL